MDSAKDLNSARPAINWKAAVLAGLATGFLFAIFPRGSPWDGLTFFNPVIMGRTFLPGTEPGYFVAFLIHLLVSTLYSLVIAAVVYRFRNFRAVFVGGLVGMLLYLLNSAIVGFAAPELAGSESAVLFTHLAFGLIAAGAYKGLARGSSPTMFSSSH